MDEYMKLKSAADKATEAWLANDSAANLLAMKNADSALNAARSAGLNIIKVSESSLAQMMDRSVFGTVDRIRAAK